MQLFADENIAAQIVHQLRELGHDVLYPPETQLHADDDVWLEKARREERILITVDKDFGELVFRKKWPPPGLSSCDYTGSHCLIDCGGSNRDGNKYCRTRQQVS